MSQEVERAEKALNEAKAELRAAGAALAPKWVGGELERYQAACDEVARLERELARCQGGPYAVPCDFPIEWDVGAPLPTLLCSDYAALLVFRTAIDDPEWDGTTVKVINPSSPEPASHCMVTFERCMSAKLGHPNDEAQGGHPLAGRGLEGYTAQIVKRSPWIAEVAKTNSVHRADNPEFWESLHHYVFWFHDSTFECLARGYTYELLSGTTAQVLARAQKRLLS